jgi:hypothetical protein
MHKRPSPLVTPHDTGSAGVWLPVMEHHFKPHMLCACQQFQAVPTMVAGDTLALRPSSCRVTMHFFQMPAVKYARLADVVLLYSKANAVTL